MTEKDANLMTPGLAYVPVGNFNDCHDEKGLFCEGEGNGGNSTLGIGKMGAGQAGGSRNHEWKSATGKNVRLEIKDEYVPKVSGIGVDAQGHDLKFSPARLERDAKIYLDNKKVDWAMGEHMTLIDGKPMARIALPSGQKAGIPVPNHIYADYKKFESAIRDIASGKLASDEQRWKEEREIRIKTNVAGGLTPSGKEW
jgi:hypothetical protein